jgi:hypothetical protein
MKRTGSGSGGQGIIVRGNPSPLGEYKTWGSGYFLLYDQDGDVFAGKRGDGFWYTSTQNPHVDVDGWNVLKIVAYDDVLIFYLNGSQLHQHQDYTLGSGLVGVEMTRPLGSTDNLLKLDWAKLEVIKY